MENTYSRILDNIEENTGLTGLVQKYNPNYKFKLQLIDQALEKGGNTRKKNSFNDTEISIIYSNKNNDNSLQYNDIINNTNNNLNDSKYGTNNNFIIPMDRNSKGKISKGKNIFKILNNFIFLILGGSRHYLMKRNSSFVRTLISNYEGSPQIQKIELKRQKKKFCFRTSY